MSCATPLDDAERPLESRKVVTVLFADLRGSTAIGERLDPEAVRRVLTRFYDAARESIERHGGTVEKFIGDAVMAVFGVPLVHEDDAIRGVRAAAELQQELGRMNDELLRAKYGVGLELRIGVNTGEVVAGDPATGSSFVAGDAVNVGARLEQAAPPGEVLIGEETWRAVRDVVDVEPTEPLELKGKSERVPAFRLIGFRVAEVPGGIAPLLGRGRERRELDSVLDLAIAGPRAVTITLAGPPGIGKTHLAEDALDRWHRERGARTVRVRCVAEGEGDPLGSIVGLVVGLLDLPADAKSADVGVGVRDAMTAHERAPVVASALAGLMGGDTRPPIGEVAWAVAELVVRAADVGPVAILVDDAHWSDADLDAVMHEVTARPDVPVVLVRTVLPEFAHGEDPETLDVGPLDGADALELLRSIVGEAPDNGRIVAQADGNPLFLIETARMFREGGGTEEGAELRVPTSIRGLLAARIEHLPPAEARLLETASAIGRVFPLEAASSIGGVPLEDVARSAASLESRNLLTTVGAVSGENASFSHALVRDVAYESMTKERRAELHQRYAGWLEARGHAFPTIVAHHLEQAYLLRCSLGVPGPEERLLAARAAAAFAAGGLQTSVGESRPAALAALWRAAALVHDAAGGEERPEALVAARASAGRLAVDLGDWPIAVDLLELLIADGEADEEAIYGMGVALTQAHRGHADAPELDRGRSLLGELLERAPTADVAASLAGSWKGIDDRRALGLYRSALDLDPGHPYALGNVVELEAAESGSLDGAPAMRTFLEAAAERCRAEIERGENQPWSCYDLAKFSLLVDAQDEAFSAACLAVARSSAAFMVETSLSSFERFAALDDSLPGLSRLIALYRLALAAVFGDTSVVERLPVTPGADPFTPPVVIVAGGSSLESETEVLRFGPLVREAMRGGGGTLVSGATRQGVSVIAGDVAEDESFRAIGYLPAEVPEDVQVDDERYAELRRTTGEDFSVAEPLQYWSDVVAGGIAPSDVRLLAIGGGQISAAEYRMALALGARVGAISGSGGSASELLRDPWWAATARLVELVPELAAMREFLTAQPASP
jgi:class 3 adenylate cyclase